MNAIQNLIKQLQDTSNPIAQANAAEELALLAEEGQQAAVALVQHCGSPNEALRNWCTGALESLGAPATDQIDDLALLTRSANTDVVFWAATLLGRAGARARSAVAVLSERSSDASAPAVQKRAAWALKKIQSA